MSDDEIIKLVKHNFYGKPYEMWCYINTFLPDAEKNSERTEHILAACV